MNNLGRLAVVLASVAAVVSVPSLEATTSPYCEASDRPAAYLGYDDWYRTVLGPQRRLPDSYEPPDLVPASEAKFVSRLRVRALIVPHLRALREAGAADGVTLLLMSAYRSAKLQRELFDRAVLAEGLREAERLVARPGHSEHQLGTTLDFADTPGAYRWLALNAWRFGFVRSYGGGAHRCIAREDWHFRYLGTPQAREITERALEPNDYLAERYGD